MKPLLNLLIILLLGNTICFAEETIPDAQQPLNIESVHVEFDDQHGTAIYTGFVIADQGSRHLTSDKLTIYRGKDNKIELVIAIGTPAHFQSQQDPNKPIEFGTADTIKYFPNENKVDLIGNASLEQDGNSITGPFLSYFFTTSLLKSESSPIQQTTVILKPKSESI